MASEVVCGLIFRLLLPICLTVGEYGPLSEVTCEGEGGAQGRGRASEQSQVKGSSALGLGSEVRAVRLAQSGVPRHGPLAARAGVHTWGLSQLSSCRVWETRSACAGECLC